MMTNTAIHPRDAPHIQRQITSAPLTTRKSGVYYGSYSGEYIAPRQ
jgi:hypothetical protein